MPYYRTTSNEIIFIDSNENENLLPEGCVPLQDTDVLDLVELPKLKAKRWEDIKSERDRRTLEGGYQVNGKWFHSDLTSRSQHIGLMLMGSNMPTTILWKTMDGSFVQMTPELAHQIFLAAATSDGEIFKVAEIHKAAVMAAPTASAVWLHNISFGWPKVYGE